MMPKPNDETLIAYLDGEVDAGTRAEIDAWLESDAALRDEAAGLSASAEALRLAFEPVLHEEIPERLLLAARGQTGAALIDLATVRQKRGSLATKPWMQWAVAAGVAGLLIGGGVGYFSGSGVAPTSNPATNLASANWLDNIAGYHKLFVNAGADDLALVDVPANSADAARKAVQKLPADFRLPNLQPWGLQFQGARYLVVEGQPATQLFYTTDNKSLGSLTVVVGTTNRPDLAPSFDRRGDLNVLYWRHHGHAYTLVGSADIGYLWNISNDIAYQLDAI
jgi:anti-sigma factor RsiW